MDGKSDPNGTLRSWSWSTTRAGPTDSEIVARSVDSSAAVEENQAAGTHVVSTP